MALVDHLVAAHIEVDNNLLVVLVLVVRMDCDLLVVVIDREKIMNMRYLGLDQRYSVRIQFYQYSLQLPLPCQKYLQK